MLQQIHALLGIPADYDRRCGMPQQPECDSLVEVGNDALGRPARLEAATAAAWQRLQQAALVDGVELQLVSAFRSVDYQRQLIQRKLDRGFDITSILQVNAAPGFSEHHSGRALDIGCPGYPHLEEVFEHSAAFVWLNQRAGEFGFRLSFPRNNPFGVMYEPWHWYFLGVDQANDQIGNSEPVQEG
jgi:D-alanyl-D-alanine carboxypeptidase